MPTATVRDLASQTDHTGRTPDSIVRRVWGRRAELRFSSDPNAPEDHALVVERDSRQTSAYHVLASVRVTP